jgi:hypothetical protein
MIIKNIFLTTIFSIFLLNCMAQEKGYTFCLNNELIFINEGGAAAYSVYDINSKKLLKEYQGKYVIEEQKDLNKEIVKMDIKIGIIKLRLKYDLIRDSKGAPQILVNKANGVHIPLCGTNNNTNLSVKNNVNNSITKDDAVKLLKEKKELLDLGLISQEDYDKIKKEMSIYILKK